MYLQEFSLFGKEEAEASLTHLVEEGLCINQATWLHIKPNFRGKDPVDYCEYC